MIVAEPGALIGFAPRRVAEEATGKALPKDSHTAEFYLRHGMVDAIVDRQRLKRHLETMLDLIRPGGLLVMSNWFPLQDAVLGHSEIDWSGFSGPDWADRIQAYASKLAAHPQLSLSFVLRPWLGLAVKTA